MLLYSCFYTLNHPILPRATSTESNSFQRPSSQLIHIAKRWRFSSIPTPTWKDVFSSKLLKQGLILFSRIKNFKNWTYFTILGLTLNKCPNTDAVHIFESISLRFLASLICEKPNIVSRQKIITANVPSYRISYHIIS